ncbi:MAG: TldD/PmbA family protein [Candidatus Cloacimonetes bacterium]|nr:TldD/PmbA family protein [Candidatus Cloacimonadota bacterium]
MKNIVYDIMKKLESAEITFADVRLTSTDYQSIYFEKGALKNISTEHDSIALGVRVLINGCWGFAGINNLNPAGIDKMINRALNNARAGSLFKKEKITFPAIKPTVGSYQFKPLEDPFLLSDEEKLDYLGKIAKMLTGNEKIVHSNLYCSFHKQYKVYINSEGTFTDMLVYDTLPVMEVTASDGEQVMNRTYPGHMSARRGGFEVVRDYDFPAHAEEIVQEAIDLLSASTITEERADLIIKGGHLALQLHESVGHATEADRIFGMEISYAGKTFIKPEMLGKFRYGSEHVNIYSDSTDPKGIGYHPVDDDGVPGRRVNIIKDGILVNQQTSREVAHKLGLEPSSNMKASFADDFPLIRMTNFCLAPGKGSLDEMIKDTENGYLVDYTKTWSIDDNRNNFQFTTEIGWKIKDGKIIGIVKEPTYYGITPEFWNACDRICGLEEWGYFSTFHCGKGEPGQAMHLSHGVAPARFKDVVVNVKA